MVTPPLQGGASIHARGRIPSTDLSSLVALLVDAFPPKQDVPDDARSWEVLSYDPHQKRLVLNTYGILRRFAVRRKMLDRFKQSEGSGFLRDLASPARGYTARMGGRLYGDDLGGLSEQVTTLKELINAELDRLEVTPDSILVMDPEVALNQLGHAIGLKDFLGQRPARLVPMAFATSPRPAAAREKDVARVLSAEEEIQAEDWLEQLAESIARAQAYRDDEFDDVQRGRLVETLRQDFDKPDSQITRFLNFLEDEALARVRLVVSFALMKAIATQDGATQPAVMDLRDYVDRVWALYDLYGAPDAEHSFHLRLSRDYGLYADFSVSDELVKALFYNCLPTWAEWNTQLFESRRVDMVRRGVSVVREVSYRFRVNGPDPLNEMLPAFDSRLTRIRTALRGAATGMVPHVHRLHRAIAEAVFLWLVLNPDLTASTLSTNAPALAQRLEREGRAGVEQLLDDLSAWSGRARSLSSTLVAILRSKAPNVVSHAQRAIDDLYLVVQQGVVDWAAIERSRGRAHEPLVRTGEGQSEQVEWFKYVKIASRPDGAIDPLFSVRVKTVLRERTLVAHPDGISTILLRREVPRRLLNVTWQPIHVDDMQPHRVQVRDTVEHEWRMGVGVDIWYEPDLLSRRDVSNSRHTAADRLQYRAATATAFAVLVYVFLQVLADRLARARGERIPMLMLRFQIQGRDAAPSAGDSLIYAAAQAVEGALMRDTPVRMQGMLTIADDLRYRKWGTAFALASAFPLAISTPAPPVVPKVAVLIYSTRPCDQHPWHRDVVGYVFRAKTYLAEVVTEPFAGYRLAFDRMQSYVVESDDAFTNPTLILEEVSRLYRLGYSHILLISSHFGNPHINRAAQRHSPHTQTTFLDRVALRFPEVRLYMLRRDVFPATRLHTRGKEESAFEAVRLVDHHELRIDHGDAGLKQLIPIFTFATLSVVGNDEARRPQSGFCTYFLDMDYQVRSIEWRERVRANLLGTNAGVRDCLLAVLGDLHFLEAEKLPEAGLCRAVLDPFGWVTPASSGAAGELEVVPAVGRNGKVLLSLPALLSHITDALHRGGSR